MLHPFKILSEKSAFEIPNRLSVIEATLRTPEDKEVTWHCVAMRDVSVVLPMDAEGNVYLKSEWRLSRKDFVWELASGFLEGGATDALALETADRELQEELGMKAGTLEKVLTFYPHNHMRTRMHLFIGTDLKPLQEKVAGDEHEFVEAKKLPFDEAYDLVMNQQAPNAQTALLFMSAALRRK